MSLWETCEIKRGYQFHLFESSRQWFTAIATGINGVYVAQETNWVRDDSRWGLGASTRVICDSLVKELTRAGWEHLEQYGLNWWEQRYRRIYDPTRAIRVRE